MSQTSKRKTSYQLEVVPLEDRVLLSTVTALHIEPSPVPAHIGEPSPMLVEWSEPTVEIQGQVNLQPRTNMASNSAIQFGPAVFADLILFVPRPMSITPANGCFLGGSTATTAGSMDEWECPNAACVSGGIAPARSVPLSITAKGHPSAPAIAPDGSGHRPFGFPNLWRVDTAIASPRVVSPQPSADVRPGVRPTSPNRHWEVNYSFFINLAPGDLPESAFSGRSVQETVSAGGATATDTEPIQGAMRVNVDET
jgi:hypothetical protein